MGQPTSFVIRLDSDELARWKRAAEHVAKETRAAPNVSALIRRAMDAEIERQGVPAEKPKRGGR